MSETRQKLEADVVIVGAGPAGLTAALTLANSNKKVILLEKREEKYAFIRPQLVHLQGSDGDILEMLEKMKLEDPGLKEMEIRDPRQILAEMELKNPRLSEDDKRAEENFQDQLEDKTDHVAIKDIQRFIKRRIDDNKNVDCKFGMKLEKIDLDNGLLTVDSPEGKIDIQFTDLISADGNAHGNKNHTVQLLKENGHTIEFEQKFDSTFKDFLSGYLTVKRKDGGQFAITDKFVDHYKGKKGFDYVYYHHASLQKSDYKQLKFCVASCISDSDLKKFEEDKEAGFQHMIEIAKQTFPDDEYEITPVKGSEKYGAIKDSLKYQIFQREFYEAVVNSERTSFLSYWGCL